LQIDFFVKSEENFKIPSITSLKLNNVQVCPENNVEQKQFDSTLVNQGDEICAKFIMNSNGTGGRWDGTLTVFPQFPGNELRVDILFDEPAWALAVNC
jgi:hypothetical protein